MLSSSRVTSPLRLKPGTRSFIRLSVRRKVDLPDPVGPMSAVIDPRFSETFTSERTVRPEKPRSSLTDSMTNSGRAASGSRALSVSSIADCASVVTTSLRISVGSPSFTSWTVPSGSEFLDTEGRPQDELFTKKTVRILPDSPGGLAVPSRRRRSGEQRRKTSPLKEPDCNPSVRCTPSESDSHLPTFQPQRFMLVRPS